MVKFSAKGGAVMTLSQKEIKTITKNELFLNYSEETLQKALVFMSAKTGEYKKGECLCRAGRRLYSFGLVLGGAVQVFFDDINGDRVIMATVGEGETFGESLCYLKEKNVPVWVYASENAKILWLSCDCFHSNVCAHPDLQQLYSRFTAMIAKKTLSMNDRVQILSKLTLREKLNTYFSQCVRKNKSRTFKIPLDRESLAIYLGTNRSALSRELSKMQKEGLIEFYKNVFKIL